MQLNRRRADKSIWKNPYIQVIGGMFTVISLVFISGGKYQSVDAAIISHEVRIKSLEDHQAFENGQIEKIDGKLEVLLNYMGVPHKK